MLNYNIGSAIMTRTTVWGLMLRGAFVLMLLALISTFANSQNYQNWILNGNVVNNGTIRVARDIINNTTSPVTVSGTGVVVLWRNNGTHAIRSASGGNYSITFSNLDLIDNRPTTAQVDVTVTNRLRIGDGTTAYTAAGNGFDIGNLTLTINNESSYMSTSTSELTFNNGTVVFNGDNAQSILNKASGTTTYGILSLSGNGAKTVQSGALVLVEDAISQAGGQLSVTENMNVSGSVNIADLGAVSSGKTFRLLSTATGSIASNAISNAGAIIDSSAVNISFSNAIANDGEIANKLSGRIDFNGDLTGSGTIRQTGNGTIEVGGAFTQNTYDLNAGTVIYNSNTAGQNIVGTTYNNLTLNNASKILQGSVTVNGNLELDANSALDMNNNNAVVGGNLVLGSNITTGTGVLTLTSTVAGNVSGSGQVIGAVRRNHNFASGQNYRFNSANIYMATADNINSDVTLRMIPSTDPSNPPTTKYVSRKYELIPASMGNLEAIQLYYANGELQGGIAESKIGLRAYNGTNWTKITNPGMTRSSGGNYVAYSGLNNSLAGVQELGMFGISFVTAANNANISTPAGWDENQMPDNTDDATIAHTGVVTGANPVSVATLTINEGSDLSTNGTGVLTVASSTQVNGMLSITNTDANLADITIGSNGSISVSSGRTLTGGSLTNNSSSASTFTGNVSLTSLVNNGTGALSFNGNNSSITGAVSNNAGATISVAGLLSIMTSSPLTLESYGNITITGANGILNVGKSGVESSLKMSGTSTLKLDNASAQLNVYGNLELGANATLDNIGVITIGE